MSDQRIQSSHRSEKIMKAIICFIFVLYILVLLKIILFKDVSLSQIFHWEVSGYRSYNLIPFKTVYDYISLSEMSPLRVFSNIIGNIGVFMPLGYLLPLIFKRMKKLRKVLLLSIAFSISFEILQYVFSLGSLDVDDVILNVTGACLGYGFYYFFNGFFKTKRTFYIATLILIIISSAIAFVIVKEEFGDLIGLDKYDVEYINDKEIPKEEPDIYGLYNKIKDNKISIYQDDADNSSGRTPPAIREVDINPNTKFFYQNTKEKDGGATVKFEELSLEDIKEIEKDSPICLWMDKDNSSSAEVVLITDKPHGNDDEMQEDYSSSETKKLEGSVEKISDDGVVINIITTVTQDDGSQVSSSGEGIYKKLTDVIFAENAKYSYQLISEAGSILEERPGTKQDIKKDSTLELYGNKDGDTFIADTVNITEIK